jgi:hypothetical protein
MKRNILLGFLLIGLVVMEWGCKDKIYYSSTYTITGVESTTWAKYRHSTRDRYRHDSLMLFVQFQTLETRTEVSTLKNTSVYALSPASLVPENTIDSILIFSNGVDYTKNFTSFHKDSDLREFSISREYDAYGYGTPLSLAFGINGPLSPFVDTFQFTFQFYDTEGNIFETTTDPIIITP